MASIQRGQLALFTLPATINLHQHVQQPVSTVERIETAVTSVFSKVVTTVASYMPSSPQKELKRRVQIGPVLTYTPLNPPIGDIVLCQGVQQASSFPLTHIEKKHQILVTSVGILVQFKSHDLTVTNEDDDLEVIEKEKNAEDYLAFYALHDRHPLWTHPRKKLFSQPFSPVTLCYAYSNGANSRLLLANTLKEAAFLSATTGELLCTFNIGEIPPESNRASLNFDALCANYSLHGLCVGKSLFFIEKKRSLKKSLTHFHELQLAIDERDIRSCAMTPLRTPLGIYSLNTDTLLIHQEEGFYDRPKDEGITHKPEGLLRLSTATTSFIPFCKNIVSCGPLQFRHMLSEDEDDPDYLEIGDSQLVNADFQAQQTISLPSGIGTLYTVFENKIPEDFGLNFSSQPETTCVFVRPCDLNLNPNSSSLPTSYQITFLNPKNRDILKQEVLQGDLCFVPDLNRAWSIKTDNQISITTITSQVTLPQTFSSPSNDPVIAYTVGYDNKLYLFS